MFLQFPAAASDFAISHVRVDALKVPHTSVIRKLMRGSGPLDKFASAWVAPIGST